MGAFRSRSLRGTWGAQSAKHPTLDSAQVTISKFMGLSLTLDSVPIARSLLRVLSLGLSLSLPLLYSLSLFLKIKKKEVGFCKREKVARAKKVSL